MALSQYIPSLQTSECYRGPGLTPFTQNETWQSIVNFLFQQQTRQGATNHNNRTLHYFKRTAVQEPPAPTTQSYQGLCAH